MKINLIALAFLVLLATAGSACAQITREQSKPSASTAAGAPCAPLETNPPNASSQKPAFAGQTRACGVKSDAAFEVTVLAKGLEKPWAVEPLPGGDLLVTEKAGRMRIVSAKGEVGQPIGGLLPVGQGGVSAASGQGGLPPVDARGQGGLLDVALSPSFATDRTIYWSFSEPRGDGNGTSIARGVL